MKNSIFLAIVALFLIGCSSKKEIEFTKPEIQTPKKQPEPKRNKGSLYSVQGTSLFADKKDLQVGDIIQIVINEDLTSKSNNKKKFDKKILKNKL